MNRQLDRSKCASCGGASDGVDQASLPDGSPDPAQEFSAIPICKACWDSGRYQKWWNAALKEVQECPIIMPSCDYTGNLAIDLQIVRANMMHDERIKDGICPNGCGQMNPYKGSNQDGECPSCGFVLHANYAINFQ